MRQRLLNGLVLSALTIFMVGCGSLEKTAFRTIGTTSTLVDAGMSAWGDHVRAGAVSAEQQTKVKETYVQYQKSMAVAKAAVLAYKNGSTEDSVLKRALDVIEASADSVLELVKAFLPPETAVTVKTL